MSYPNRKVTRVFGNGNAQLECGHVAMGVRTVASPTMLECTACPEERTAPLQEVRCATLGHREATRLFLQAHLHARILGMTQNELGHFTVFYVE